MKRFGITLLLLICAFVCKAQIPTSGKVSLRN